MPGLELSRSVGAALVVACLLPGVAEADVPARPLLEALSRARLQSPLSAAAQAGDTSSVGLLIEAEQAPFERATRVSAGAFFVRGSVPELAGLLEGRPELTAHWAPPLRPLLDEAEGWVGASEFRNETGLTGAGVMLGVVDTGFDVAHPDLRAPDGKTRVAWLIDFSRDPAGRHPALEDQYGCTSENFVCRILGAEDIDDILTNQVTGDEPRDERGHGTHVASLAAGNGASHDPPRYVGIAPEASLALAQVLGPDGAIAEASVLAGTQFIFDRAREADMPGVVNVSLGTDFGAHDGGSLIERSLAAFVGDREPGRALVVAAGNSAAQTVGLTADYPEPLGVHSEVHVPAGAPVRVPLLTLSEQSPTLGSVFVWLEMRPGDRLRLGFDDGTGSRVHWAEVGQSRSFAIDQGPLDVQVTLVNGPGVQQDALGLDSGSAAAVISGSWDRGRAFALHLEGQGSALIWAEGGGALLRGLGGGVFVPRSVKERTIMIPASHPELIAVGATLNRRDWPTLAQDPTRTETSALDAPLDSVAYFSSAGPNSVGTLKPELVAPGAHVVGAMSSDADPRSSRFSLFQAPSCADPACYVVDEQHAVSSGTSMAAPLVAGAAALLLQREPELSAGQLRSLLMAGSRRPAGEVPEEQQMGAGVLDLFGSLRALDLMLGEAQTDPTPSPSHSRLVLGSSFLHPDPDWPLQALLLLRDASDAITEIDEARLELDAPGAVSASLERMAPGLWNVSVAAPGDAGGRTQVIRVLVDGELLVERRAPVAVDRSVADGGFSARGGCALGSAPTPVPAGLLLFAGLVLGVRGHRR